MYITCKSTARYHTMSLDDLWFGSDTEVYNGLISLNETGTVTRVIKPEQAPYCNLYNMTMALKSFNERYETLISADKHDLYRTFYIPKSSGGLRKIDAPNDDLMGALKDLKYIFTTTFHARWLYHTSAFAYIQNRSTIDCVKKHQKNESKFFGKFDLHNFFGSTTMEFVMSMFSQIFPFSVFLGTVIGRELLENALSLCFLDGVLPQGTPMSPMLTNIMMIPLDYQMEKWCRENGLIYSRYADDFLISSRRPFKFRDVESKIKSLIVEFHAPFSLNEHKTRYGSSAGANWNFGVMLNKDNQITIGRAKKRRFEAMLYAYAKDKKSGNNWSLEEVQHFSGLISYYKMVEGDAIIRIVRHVSEKQHVNILEQLKLDLKNAT